MTKERQIYKCEVCGNITEILHAGAGELVCCGQSMILQEENTVDAVKEKHVPAIEGKVVKVGEIDHPMEDNHFIEWIEAKSEDGKFAKKFLKSGDKPKAEFNFEVKEARAYCNLHGLWSG